MSTAARAAAPLSATPADSLEPTHPGHGPRSSPLSRITFVILLVLLTAVFVAPLLWMFVTSFKTPDGATAIPELRPDGAHPTEGAAQDIWRWLGPQVLQAVETAQ